LVARAEGLVNGSEPPPLLQVLILPNSAGRRLSLEGARAEGLLREGRFDLQEVGVEFFGASGFVQVFHEQVGKGELNGKRRVTFAHIKRIHRVDGFVSQGGNGCGSVRVSARHLIARFHGGKHGHGIFAARRGGDRSAAVARILGQVGTTGAVGFHFGNGHADSLGHLFFGYQAARIVLAAGSGGFRRSLLPGRGVVSATNTREHCGEQKYVHFHLRSPLSIQNEWFLT